MQEDKQASYRRRLLGLRGRLLGETDQALGEVAMKARDPSEASDVPTHPADRDSEGLDRDIALEKNREWILESINHALDRIDEGTYGQCEDCGGEIPEPRLEALPYTTRCVACEENREGA